MSVSTAIKEKIKETIKSNPVVLYMKGTEIAPMCGFSAKVVNILQSHDVDFLAVNVLESEELRNGIKYYNNWPTIPQLFIAGEFVGGCDIVVGMNEDGSLLDLLKENGLK